MIIDIDKSKSRIMEAIVSCHNPYLLQQVERTLQRNKTLKPLEQMLKEYPILLEKGIPVDKQLKTHLTSPKNGLLSHYDTWIRPFIFFLSLLMLILGAVILNTLSHNPENFGMVIFQDLVVRIYLIIWLFFLFDYLLLLYLARKIKKKIPISEFIFRSFALLFPPLRLASRHIEKIELTWLPFYGWCKCNEGLQKQIRRQFSIPMIVIAFLIIPVLLIEWKFYEEVSAYLATDLTFWLDCVQAFIWMAFAFEFILMLSISTDKLEYAMRNWIDLLIILLPFVSFIRSMRIVKIARLGQIARGYKLRGLLIKAKQGFIFASFFSRILILKPNFQVKQLKKKLEKNHKERENLEEELIELFRAIKTP